MATRARNRQGPRQPQVGDFVEIYWVNDDEWYRGRLNNRLTGQRNCFRIHYDDGDEEDIKITDETWRFAPNKRKRSRSLSPSETPAQADETNRVSIASAEAPDIETAPPDLDSAVRQDGALKSTRAAEDDPCAPDKEVPRVSPPPPKRPRQSSGANTNKVAEAINPTTSPSPSKLHTANNTGTPNIEHDEGQDQNRAGNKKLSNRASRRQPSDNHPPATLPPEKKPTPGKTPKKQVSKGTAVIEKPPNPQAQGSSRKSHAENPTTDEQPLVPRPSPVRRSLRTRTGRVDRETVTLNPSPPENIMTPRHRRESRQVASDPVPVPTTAPNSAIAASALRSAYATTATAPVAGTALTPGAAPFQSIAEAVTPRTPSRVQTGQTELKPGTPSKRRTPAKGKWQAQTQKQNDPQHQFSPLATERARRNVSSDSRPRERGQPQSQQQQEKKPRESKEPVQPKEQSQHRPLQLQKQSQPQPLRQQHQAQVQEQLQPGDQSQHISHLRTTQQTGNTEPVHVPPQQLPSHQQVQKQTQQNESGRVLRSRRLRLSDVPSQPGQRPTRTHLSDHAPVAPTEKGDSARAKPQPQTRSQSRLESAVKDSTLAPVSSPPANEPSATLAEEGATQAGIGVPADAAVKPTVAVAPIAIRAGMPSAPTSVYVGPTAPELPPKAGPLPTAVSTPSCGAAEGAQNNILEIELPSKGRRNDNNDVLQLRAELRKANDRLAAIEKTMDRMSTELSSQRELLHRDINSLVEEVRSKFTKLENYCQGQNTVQQKHHRQDRELHQQQPQLQEQYEQETHQEARHQHQHQRQHRPRQKPQQQQQQQQQEQEQQEQQQRQRQQRQQQQQQQREQHLQQNVQTQHHEAQLTRSGNGDQNYADHHEEHHLVHQNVRQQLRQPRRSPSKDYRNILGSLRSPSIQNPPLAYRQPPNSYRGKLGTVAPSAGGAVLAQSQVVAGVVAGATLDITGRTLSRVVRPEGGVQCGILIEEEVIGGEGTGIQGDEVLASKCCTGSPSHLQNWSREFAQRVFSLMSRQVLVCLLEMPHGNASGLDLKAWAKQTACCMYANVVERFKMFNSAQQAHETLTSCFPSDEVDLEWFTYPSTPGVLERARINYRPWNPSIRDDEWRSEMVLLKEVAVGCHHAAKRLPRGGAKTELQMAIDMAQKAVDIYREQGYSDVELASDAHEEG